MRIKELLKEDDAVSPVIGVILMVAITVILAAVIASFVLGLGDSTGDVQPNSNFNFDYNVTDGVANDLTITLTDGDSIETEDLYVRGSIDGNEGEVNWNDATASGSPGWGDISGTIGAANGVGGFTSSSNEIKAGQGVNIEGSGSGDIDAYDLDVVWDTGDDSATLGEDDNEA